MNGITLRFTRPEDITPWGLDGIVIRFRYSAVDSDLVGAPEEKQCTTAHVIDVSISRHRRISWNVDDAGLVKVLFEIAMRGLAALVEQGDLPKEYKESVLLNTHPHECPFDPDRIQEPDGAVVVLERSRRMGFK